MKWRVFGPRPRATGLTGLAARFYSLPENQRGDPQA